MELLGIIDSKTIKIIESKEEILKSECFQLISAIFKGLIRERIKFVAISKDDEYYIYFFMLTRDHIKIAKQLNENKFNFVGAGFCDFSINKNNPKIYFNSETCENFFGYDRPKNKDEQNLIIENIEKLIKDLFEIFS